MGEPAYGPWFTIHRCVECKERLSGTQVMYSGGRCPHCGHKAPEACTIVSTVESAARRTKLPWWNFWGKTTIQERR